MKSFSFRLDRILRLRENAEQVQAKRLGEAARDEAERSRDCVEQAAFLADVGERIAPEAGQRTNAGLLRVLQLTSAAAAMQLAEAERARAEAAGKAEAERTELARAQAERKSLTRLKEQQYATWREDAGRRERSEMDEIAARNRGSR